MKPTASFTFHSDHSLPAQDATDTGAKSFRNLLQGWPFDPYAMKRVLPQEWGALMSAPNPACLKAVCVQLEEAQAHILAACTLLRTNGYPESADDLMRSARSVKVWRQRDGWLEFLSREPIPVACGQRLEAAE